MLVTEASARPRNGSTVVRTKLHHPRRRPSSDRRDPGRRSAGCVCGRAAQRAGSGRSARAARPAATTALNTSNNTPFPTSTLITGASWTSAPSGPPSNQFGDILSTSSVESDSLYVLMDDGGTGTSGGALWRNSFALVTGSPGKLQFTSVGSSPAPQTYAQVHGNEQSLTGPLGSYYSMGFTVANGVFYATQANNWNWNANGPFQGLAGIAYSTDRGQHWFSVKKPFPDATGNLNWIQFPGETGTLNGYVYAIATEREFNASSLILGRARADTADITDPSRWQWASGSITLGGHSEPIWTGSIADAEPILTWQHHITYPRMSYDAGLHRYLLTFTYSYADTPPGVWKDGSELVVLESAEPWGPFSFVARDSYFGPSNGYDPAFPENWISSNGLDLWMIWAANFDGCASGLDCSGAYAFNYRRLQLTVASHPAGATRTSRGPARPPLPPLPPLPPSGWRHLPGTPARHRLPRVYTAPTPPRRPLVDEEPTTGT